MATQTVHATLPDNIQAARIRLCSPAKKPYLAGILFRLTPVAMKGLKTMAVDKHARLYFDPDEIWPIDVYETVLYHEVCHLLRDHAGRQECMHADPEKWNTAADAEINDDIIAEGPCKWPFEVVTPKTIGQKDGLLAEEYYANLPKQPQGKGQGKGQGVGNGQCGGAAGNPKEYEIGAPATSGGKKDTPGLSEAEMEAVRGKVAADVNEHAKTQGNVPGHLARWADGFLHPRIKWEKVLRAKIRRAVNFVTGLHDYTYRKPARRRVPKVVLPSMQSPKIRTSVVVDTSGSMAPEQLERAVAEVGGIVKSLGLTEGLTVLSVDTQVTITKNVFKASDVRLIGGGGTDMCEGVRAAVEVPQPPNIVIVLTDGFTSWPDKVGRGAQLVIGLVGKGRAKPETCPSYATVVEIDD